MPEVSNSPHKSVKEVHIKREEVNVLLFAAAITRMEEVPGVEGALRTAAVVSDGYGGYIIDVIVDTTSVKQKKGTG